MTDYSFYTRRDRTALYLIAYRIRVLRPRARLLFPGGTNFYRSSRHVVCSASTAVGEYTTEYFHKCMLSCRACPLRLITIGRSKHSLGNGELRGNVGLTEVVSGLHANRCHGALSRPRGNAIQKCLLVSQVYGICDPYISYLCSARS